MQVDGLVADGFERVRDAFEQNFAARGDFGAACAVYAGGELVVDLHGGLVAAGSERPYAADTLQMVASATKGALAILVQQLVEAGELDLDAPVAAYWPEFAAAGKAEVPVRWLLTHQAGVPYLDRPVSVADMRAWTPVADALAAQPPAWPPGTRHGYHALTYGWLVGEVVRRVSGRSPGRLFAEKIGRPLGLDLHIGLARADVPRVAPLRPAPPPPPGDPFAAGLADPDSLAHKAFFVPSGLFAMMNDPEFWQAEVPAANGMSTALALARMYAACLWEVDGVRLLRSDTLAAATAEQVRGPDAVTGYETRYGMGFQLSFPFRPMAGEGSFGHYGLGGSVGFASRRHGFAFGYTVNQMGPATPADPRSVALIEAVVASLP